MSGTIHIVKHEGKAFLKAAPNVQGGAALGDAILSDILREDAVGADTKLVSLSRDTTDEATLKILRGIRQFLHAGMYIEAARLAQKNPSRPVSQ